MTFSLFVQTVYCLVSALLFLFSGPYHSQVFFIEKFCVLWNCLRPPTQGVHYNSTAQFHLDAPNHFRFSGVEFSLWPPPTPLGDLHQQSGDNAKKLDLAETIFLVQSRASGRPSLSRYSQTLFLSDVKFRPEPPTHLPISTFLSIFEQKHLT